MRPYTLSFDEVDGTRLPEVGGKGANLGELTRAGFQVPPGFCVTTAAYRKFVQTSGEFEVLLDSLDRVTHEDLDRIRSIGVRIRENLESLVMPADVRSAVLHAWRELGTEHAYAVRSSATAKGRGECNLGVSLIVGGRRAEACGAPFGTPGAPACRYSCLVPSSAVVLGDTTMCTIEQVEPGLLSSGSRVGVGEVPSY
jgi:hypothetical protein